MSSRQSIEQAIRDRWCGAKGWLTVDEVADAPGFGAGRRLDMVAVGVWGMNSMHTVGFEVKRSTADWRRELDQPAKREAFVDSVNEFVFVAPWNVIRPTEVPEGCGLLSVTESGDLRFRVRPKARSAKPSDDFIACLFRAALRQIQKTQDGQHRFAEWRGRSLSFRDLRALVDKVHGRMGSALAAQVEAGRIERQAIVEKRRRYSRVFDALARIARDHHRNGVQGDYVDGLLETIERVRMHTPGADHELVAQLRACANRIEARR